MLASEFDLEKFEEITDEWINELLIECFSPTKGFDSVQLQQSFAANPEPWEFTCQSGEIMISTKITSSEKKSKNRNIHKVRGHKKDVKEISAAKFYGSVSSVSDQTKLMDPMFKNGKVLYTIHCEKDEQEMETNASQILYLRYSLGSPLWDRDFLVVEKRKKVKVVLKDNDNQPIEEEVLVIILKSIDDLQLQKKLGIQVAKEYMTQSWDVVRGQILETGWLFRSTSNDFQKDGCDVIHLVQVDPNGWLPSFIINYFAHEQPLYIKNAEDYLLKRSSSQ